MNTWCSWTVARHPHHAIELEITDIALPRRADSGNCTDDFLLVLGCTSTDNDPGRKFCGSTLPRKLQTCATLGVSTFVIVAEDQRIIRYNDNDLCVVLRTSNAQPMKGFKATFRQICGGLITVTQERQYIRSPNFPHGSVNTRGCQWILQAPTPDEKVILTFTRMIGIDSGSACDESHCENIFCMMQLNYLVTFTAPGYLRVRDGSSADSPVVGTFCGSRLPRPIISQGDSLYLEQVGGAIAFQATFATSHATCGGQLTAASGYIVSPGYPNNYPIEIE